MAIEVNPTKFEIFTQYLDSNKIYYEIHDKLFYFSKRCKAIIFDEYELLFIFDGNNKIIIWKGHISYILSDYIVFDRFMKYVSVSDIIIHLPPSLIDFVLFNLDLFN